MPCEQESFESLYEATTVRCTSHLRLVKTEPCAVSDHLDIVSAVENALSHAGGLDCAYIFVSANGADVTLSGWVATSPEIGVSTEVAANVIGVQSVQNHLTRSL